MNNNILEQFSKFTEQARNGTLSSQTKEHLYETSRDSFLSSVDSGRFDYVELPELQKLSYSNKEIKDHYKEYLTTEFKDWEKPSLITVEDCISIKEKAHEAILGKIWRNIEDSSPTELLNKECPPEYPNIAGAKNLVERDTNFWYALPKDIAHDKEVIQHTLYHGGEEIAQNFPKHIADDYEFMRECHQVNPMALHFLPEDSTIKQGINKCSSPDEYFQKIDLADKLQNELSQKQSPELKQKQKFKI